MSAAGAKVEAAKNADIEAALTTLKDAGVSAATLSTVRQEIDTVRKATAGVVKPSKSLSTGEVAGKAILTSLFGESKADRVVRERREANERRRARRTAEENASELAAAATAGVQAEQPVVEAQTVQEPAVEAQRQGPKDRPSWMSDAAAAEFPASAKRGAWLEERLAMLPPDSGGRREIIQEMERIKSQAVTKAEKAEIKQRQEEKRAKEQAADALAAALTALEYGQIPGTATERQALRGAIEASRACGLNPDDVTRAEGIEGLVAVKAEEQAIRDKENAEREAKLAAERAAVETAALEKRRAEEAAIRAADAAKAAAALEIAFEKRELEGDKQRLKDSVAFSGPQRKQVLRELQVKWHPDKQYASETNQEGAADLLQMVNEAFAIAKKNAKARGESF